MKKSLILSFAFLLVLPSVFAWDGLMALDADKRNIEKGEIISYEGFLYWENLLEGEQVFVTVTEQQTDKTIWNTSIIPDSKTVEYFNNTAWMFNFQVDTSNLEYQDGMTYVVKAQYDDKDTKLDFLIKDANLQDKAADAGEAIVDAGEKTGQVILDAGSEAGEAIIGTGKEAGEMVVETGTEAMEKGAVIGEVVVEKTTESGQAIIEKGSEGMEEINEKGGGCLIATATFDSELSPQVQQLRDVRDNILLSTVSGSSFMTGFNQIYYTFSPSISDWERENPFFKESIRLLITPMLYSLSILDLVEEGSEPQILGLGISVIVLNLGMYVAAPVMIGFQTIRYFKSKV